MMQFSRPPPPSVAPLVRDGVRYEQVMNATILGERQVGGFLAAIDDRSGERLWTLKIYDVAADPVMEGDVQDVFFTRMAWADGVLEIENEAGDRYKVDPKTRAVTPAG
ncbi:hypothetical protein [Inquilinus sp. CAU 1745]|uniref:hypothetical protein n=1 Tax=Inquilinus sp. CAU 1745 TaxID=3140369 RepID=UPI00325A7A41